MADPGRQAIAPYALTLLRDLTRLVNNEHERDLLAQAARSLGELLPLADAAGGPVPGLFAADDAEESRLKRKVAKMAMTEPDEDKRRERRRSITSVAPEPSAEPAPAKPPRQLPPLVVNQGEDSDDSNSSDCEGEHKRLPVRVAQQEQLKSVPERPMMSTKSVSESMRDDHGGLSDGAVQTLKLGILSPALSTRRIGATPPSGGRDPSLVKQLVKRPPLPTSPLPGAAVQPQMPQTPMRRPQRRSPPTAAPPRLGVCGRIVTAVGVVGALACAPVALLWGSLRACRRSVPMLASPSFSSGKGLLMRRRHTAALALMSHQEDTEASRFVFLPGSRFIRTWEYGILLAILWVVVTAPLRLGFSLWGDAWFPFDVVVDLMFAMDIAISCNTAFQDPETDKMVAQRKVIARRYLSGGAFVIDFLSAFPFYALSDSNFARMLLMLKPLRLTRVSFITSRAAHATRSSRLRNLTRIGVFAVIIHCLSCAYWALAVEEEDVVDSSSEWMPRDDWAWLYERYANAFHWTLTSTLKSGARPETYNQYVFSSLVLLVGEVLQAYLIGSITEILTTLNLAEAEKKAQLDNVTTFLSRRRVDTDLRRRIIEFFNYRWSVGYSVKEHEVLLKQLPSQLSLELSLELKRTLIDKVPMLRSLPPESVVMVAESLHATLAVPDELIVVQGVVGTSMFFLNRGVVHMEYTPPDLADQTEPLEVQTMSIGASFGEDSLVTKKPRVATVRALTFCDMQRLSYRAYKKISVLSPEFKTAVENAHKQKNAIVQGLARSTKMLRKMAATGAQTGSTASPATPSSRSFSVIAADAARAMGHLRQATTRVSGNFMSPPSGAGGGGGATSASWRSARSAASNPASMRSPVGSSETNRRPLPDEEAQVAYQRVLAGAGAPSPVAAGPED